MALLRDTGSTALAAVVLFAAVSLTAASAEAGGYGYHATIGHAGLTYSAPYYQVVQTAPVHAYRSCWQPTHYWPSYRNTAKPFSYPVTIYDSFGRRHLVWQTTYPHLP